MRGQAHCARREFTAAEKDLHRSLGLCAQSFDEVALSCLIDAVRALNKPTIADKHALTINKRMNRARLVSE